MQELLLLAVQLPGGLLAVSAARAFVDVARRESLVEAVALSCLGGVVGLLLAQVVVAALSYAGGLPFLFDPRINIIAFATSAVIGVVFGYFPARRAAALNPIDALRHE